MSRRRFMVRDIDFSAVESLMGNVDGTVDGLPLPGRTRVFEHLRGCRPNETMVARTLHGDPQ